MPTEKNAPIDPASLEIPAPFVNKFQILVSGATVRVAFAEGFQGQLSNYRSAVAMSVTDARDLAVAIIESLPPQHNTLANALRTYTPPTDPGAATASLLSQVSDPDYSNPFLPRKR